MSRKIKQTGLALLAALLLAGTAAYAAESPTQEMPSDARTNIEEETVYLVVTDVEETDWSQVTDDPAVKDLVYQVNHNRVMASHAYKQMFGSLTVKDRNQEEIRLDHYEFLTEIFDIRFSNGYRKTESGYPVTWIQPELVNLSDASRIRILHYNIEEGRWELIRPDYINYETGEISAMFPNLSLTALIYLPEGNGVMQAAKTGDTAPKLPQAGLLASGAVLLGGLYGYRRKKQ